MKPFTRATLERDLKQSLTTDVNRLVRIMVRQLPAQSPQYTGFFASSWKASTNRPRAVDRVEDFSPWNKIKKDKDKNQKQMEEAENILKIKEQINITQLGKYNDSYIYYLKIKDNILNYKKLLQYMKLKIVSGLLFSAVFFISCTSIQEVIQPSFSATSNSGDFSKMKITPHGIYQKPQVADLTAVLREIVNAPKDSFTIFPTPEYFRLVKENEAKKAK